MVVLNLSALFVILVVLLVVRLPVVRRALLQIPPLLRGWRSPARPHIPSRNSRSRAPLPAPGRYAVPDIKKFAILANGRLEG